MAGFRGQFLDGIHPNIIKRLDADTLGFQRANAEEIMFANNMMEKPVGTGMFNVQHSPFKTFRYLQERTVWMRTVPFAIPQTKYAAPPDPDKEEVFANSPEAITRTTGKEGEAYRQASIDFTRGGNTEFYSNVPDWRDYVLYGGTVNPQLGAPVGYGGYNGLYRSEANTSDFVGFNAMGFRGTPKPGLTGIQISNKGDMGTIRRCTLNIKAFALNDLEELEMMYMVPGMSVLVEWGWYHPELYESPINLDMIEEGAELQNTQAINMEIIKKTLGVDDPYSIRDPETEDSGLGPKSGIYDGMLGVVTKFNWSNAADGTYDCRVDLISPGSLATGISTNTYAMGCTLRVDETDVQVIDIRAIMCIIRKETRMRELKAGDKIIKENFDDLGTITKKSGGWGSGATIDSDAKYLNSNLNLNTEKINTAKYGVQFSVKDGKIEATVSDDDSKSDGEYFVGDYQGGAAVEALVIKGDPKWFGDQLEQVYGVREIDGTDYQTIRKKLKAKVTTMGHPQYWKTTYQWIYGDGGEGTWGLDAAADILTLYQKQLLDGDYHVHRASKSYKYYDAGARWWMKVKATNGDWNYNAVLTDPTDHHGGTSFSQRNDWFPIKYRGEYNYKAKFNGKNRDACTPYMIHPVTGKKYNDIESLKEEGSSGDWQQGNAQDLFDKGLWKKDADGNITDKAGNTTTTLHQGTEAYNQDNVENKKWGKQKKDEFFYRKVEGVTIYKKDKDGKVTVVGHQVGTNSNEVLKLLKKKAKNLETDALNASEEEANEFLKTEANIAASMKNGGILSWIPKGAKNNFVMFSNDKEFNHVLMYALHKPAHAPEVEIGYDVDQTEMEVEIEKDDGTGKKVKGKEKQNVDIYPIGCVAYSETYVSWRFIEDYIINEIYMPKTTTDAEETMITNDASDLEIHFETVTRLSDKERENLSYGGFLKDKYGNIDQNSEEYEYEDDTKIYKSGEIINHKHLRSFNPNVCILPGQESLPKIGAMDDAQEFAKLIEDEVKAQNLSQMYIDDRPTLVDPNLQRVDDRTIMRNGFAGINEDGEEDFGRGILRNILVNADLVGEAAESADNVRKFVMTILDAINKACGKPWKFSIINVAGGNQIKIIDENYTPNAKGKSIEVTQASDETAGNPTIYSFSGVGSDNICKDVKIQSKLPNELQTMAYFSAMGASNEKGSEIQTFNMYRGAVVDRLKNISKVQIFGESGDEELRKQTITELLKNYIVLGAKARYEVEAGLEKTDSIGEGETIAEDFVKRYVHGNTIEVPGYRPILPIDVGITLNGVSGIYMGNAIMVKTVEDGGLLPSRYKGQVALQATGVDHTVGLDGWETSIGTMMRPLADVENIPTIIGKVPPKDPNDDNFEQVTEGETPNADSLRKTIEKLDKTEEKFNKTLTGPKGISSKKNDSSRKPKQGEIASAAAHKKASPADISATLARAASKVFTELNNELPGLKRLKVTAGNDYYHWVIKKDEAQMKKIGKKPYTSRHTKGKGIDFTVKPSSLKPQVDQILDRFLHANAKDKKFPATSKTAVFRFINEYDRPTSSASGGHFHFSIGDGSEAKKEIDTHSAKRFKDAGGSPSKWPYDKPKSHYDLGI